MMPPRPTAVPAVERAVFSGAGLDSSARSTLRRLRARAAGLLGLGARSGTVALMDQAVVSGTSFLTTLLMGRATGAEELGAFSLALTVVILLASVQETLVSVPYTVYLRRVPAEARAEHAGSSLAHHWMLVAAATAGLAAVAAWLTARSHDMTPVLWALGAAVPFFLAREFGRRYAFAHLRMGSALLLDGSVAVVQLGGIALLGWFGRLTAVSGLLMIGGSCALAAAGWLIANRRSFAPRWRRALPELRRNWELGGWIFAGRMVATLNSDIFMLWLLVFAIGHGATGIFAACMTIVAFSNPFLIGIGNFLTPRLSQVLADGGPAELRRVVRLASLFLMGVMGAFCAGVAFVGGWAVAYLYGPEFTGQGLTVTLLAASVLATAVSMAAATGLWALRRAELNFRASLVGLVATMTLTAVLVWPWQLAGAACGLFLGHLVESGVRMVAFHRALRAAGEGAAA